MSDTQFFKFAYKLILGGFYHERPHLFHTSAIKKKKKKSFKYDVTQRSHFETEKHFLSICHQNWLPFKIPFFHTLPKDFTFSLKYP